MIISEFAHDCDTRIWHEDDRYHLRLFSDEGIGEFSFASAETLRTYLLKIITDGVINIPTRVWGKLHQLALDEGGVVVEKQDFERLVNIADINPLCEGEEEMEFLRKMRALL